MKTRQIMYSVPDELPDLALRCSRDYLRRVAAYRSHRDDNTDMESARAHRYAIRKLREQERANGELSNLEWALGYEALVSYYFNNSWMW